MPLAIEGYALIGDCETAALVSRDGSIDWLYWPRFDRALAGEELVYCNGTGASLIVSALIIVPQIVVVLSAPWAGREAQSWGRRPLLLLGFSALTVRALLLLDAGNDAVKHQATCATLAAMGRSSGLGVQLPSN